MIRHFSDTRTLAELRATCKKLADQQSELGRALAALIAEGERLEKTLQETRHAKAVR